MQSAPSLVSEINEKQNNLKYELSRVIELFGDLSNTARGSKRGVSQNTSSISEVVALMENLQLDQKLLNDRNHTMEYNLKSKEHTNIQLTQKLQMLNETTTNDVSLKSNLGIKQIKDDIASLQSKVLQIKPQNAQIEKEIKAKDIEVLAINKDIGKLKRLKQNVYNWSYVKINELLKETEKHVNNNNMENKKKLMKDSYAKIISNLESRITDEQEKQKLAKKLEREKLVKVEEARKAKIKTLEEKRKQKALKARNTEKVKQIKKKEKDVYEEPKKRMNKLSHSPKEDNFRSMNDLKTYYSPKSNAITKEQNENKVKNCYPTKKSSAKGGLVLQSTPKKRSFPFTKQIVTPSRRSKRIQSLTREEREESSTQKGESLHDQIKAIEVEAKIAVTPTKSQVDTAPEVEPPQGHCFLLSPSNSLEEEKKAARTREIRTFTKSWKNPARMRRTRRKRKTQKQSVSNTEMDIFDDDLFS